MKKLLLFLSLCSLAALAMEKYSSEESSSEESSDRDPRVYVFTCLSSDSTKIELFNAAPYELGLQDKKANMDCLVAQSPLLWQPGEVSRGGMQDKIVNDGFLFKSNSGEDIYISCESMQAILRKARDMSPDELICWRGQGRRPESWYMESFRERWPSKKDDQELNRVKVELELAKRKSYTFEARQFYPFKHVIGKGDAWLFRDNMRTQRAIFLVALYALTSKGDILIPNKAIAVCPDGVTTVCCNTGDIAKGKKKSWSEPSQWTRLVAHLVNQDKIFEHDDSAKVVARLKDKKGVLGSGSVGILGGSGDEGYEWAERCSVLKVSKLLGRKEKLSKEDEGMFANLTYPGFSYHWFKQEVDLFFGGKQVTVAQLREFVQQYGFEKAEKE